MSEEMVLQWFDNLQQKFIDRGLGHTKYTKILTPCSPFDNHLELEVIATINGESVMARFGCHQSPHLHTWSIRFVNCEDIKKQQSEGTFGYCSVVDDATPETLDLASKHLDLFLDAVCASGAYTAI